MNTEKIAKEIKVSRRTVQRWIAGRQVPVKHLLKLAKLTGKPVEFWATHRGKKWSRGEGCER